MRILSGVDSGTEGGRVARGKGTPTDGELVLVQLVSGLHLAISLPVPVYSD
jgi:hypothetical protein